MQVSHKRMCQVQGFQQDANKKAKGTQSHSHGDACRDELITPDWGEGRGEAENDGPGNDQRKMGDGGEGG